MSMNFMEKYLVLHPVYLYGAALCLYALNLGLYGYADRKRLQVVAISAVPVLSLKTRISRTLIGALLFLAPGLFLEGDLLALFVGGFLVMQLGSLAMLLSSVQNSDALLMPGAITGHIAYSSATQARLFAASLSAIAFFSLAVFALTGSPSFFAAGLYMAATSLGYRRRARQHAALAATAQP
jgi:hypothetical protein